MSCETHLPTFSITFLLFFSRGEPDCWLDCYDGAARFTVTLKSHWSNLVPEWNGVRSKGNMPRGNNYEGQWRETGCEGAVAERARLHGRLASRAARGVFFLSSPRLAVMIWWRNGGRKEKKGMTRGQSGEVRQREAAPAIVDLKPQSCLWLILPESGGGAKGPMVSQ